MVKFTFDIGIGIGIKIDFEDQKRLCYSLFFKNKSPQVKPTNISQHRSNFLSKILVIVGYVLDCPSQVWSYYNARYIEFEFFENMWGFMLVTFCLSKLIGCPPIMDLYSVHGLWSMDP